MTILNRFRATMVTGLAVLYVWPLFVFGTGDIPVDRDPAAPVKPPLPIWPSDGETITDRHPRFRLNGRFGATGYRVELARDAAFSDPIVLAEARVVDESGIAPVVLMPYRGEPLADGQYYWRAFCSAPRDYWTPPANYRTFHVASDPDDVSITDEVGHPRLLLEAGNVDALRARIRRSEHLRLGWQHQVNTAMSSFDLEPPDESYARAGDGQHGSYSTAAGWYHRHLINVAFVAYITGNPRLADKGIEMLMAACSYERWLGPLFDQREHFDPPWHSALETAMFTYAVAVGYDLLYDRLTEDQRATVREALAEKGIRMLVREWADPIGSSQIPRHQLPTGNWVMVCACSAGVGALAIMGEHPEAEEWVRLVRDRTRAWLNDRGGDWFVDNPYARNRPAPIPVIGPSEPNFGVDGGYKESIGYMNYAMRYVCYFLDGLARATGDDLFDEIPPGILEPMAWSALAWPTPAGLQTAVVDFGDCGAGVAWYADLLAALMRHQRHPRASWLYRRTVPLPRTARSLLWYDDRVVEALPDTTVPMKAFRGIGQVIMRRGFAPESPMAAIKFHQNRGHHDLGTVYLFGNGEPTVIDSGVTGYGTRIYREYSSQSIGHNVVLVSGRGQTRANGELRMAMGTSRMTATSGELAAAYPGTLESWRRDLVMLPGGVAVVHDQLRANEAQRFDLVLHPENPFTFEPPGRLIVGDPECPRAVLEVHSDGSFEAQEFEGYYTTLPRRYVRFDGTDTSRERSFLTVCRWPLDPYRPAEPVTIASPGPGQWRMGASGPRAQFELCAGGFGAREGGWLASDARLAAGWREDRPDAVLHVVMLEGRRLIADGKEMLHATTPIDAAIEFDRPLRASFQAGAEARVTLAVDDQIRTVFVDGRKESVNWHSGKVTVDIPAGTTELEASAFDHAVPRLRPLEVPDLPTLTLPDAPSQWPDVVTRVSSGWSDGLDAFDGDANTSWVSLPGLPMPQWVELEMPRPVSMSVLEVVSSGPCAGRIETWHDEDDAWEPAGPFEITADEPLVRLAFERRTTRRLRAVVERIDPAATSATIDELRWQDPVGE
jgi:hypothetical protein